MVRFRVTLRYFAALLVLVFLSQELRMVLRMALLRWAGGCWPHRSFSQWQGCENQLTEGGMLHLASALGAFLPFVQMWLGYFLLSATQPPRRQAAGLALVFSAMPLARLMSATLAAGPEAFLLNQALNDWVGSWLLAVVVVLALTIPPAMRAHDLLSQQQRGLHFIVLLVVPVLLNYVIVSQVLDKLLAAGILAGVSAWGQPWLAVGWLGLLLVLAVGTWRLLYQPVQEAARPVLD